MAMIEQWADILGYEGLYQISSLGRVRSTSTGKEKEQSGDLGPEARYKYVTLYRNNVGRKIAVHRLVALHFIPNPHNFPYVLHKENDRSNNSKSNHAYPVAAHKR